MVVDAIRRIWVVLKAQPELRRNERIMIVFITTFSLFLLSLISMLVTYYWYFITKEKKDAAAEGFNICGVFLGVFNTATQVVMLRMLVKYSRFHS